MPIKSVKKKVATKTEKIAEKKIKRRVPAKKSKPRVASPISIEIDEPETPVKKKKRTSRTRRPINRFSFGDYVKSSLYWIVPLFLIAIGIGLFVKPKNLPKTNLVSAQLFHLFQEARDKNLSEKIAFWSQQLLENPNLLSPLGKGPKLKDSVPLYPASFDCTTYVETVGALAKSSDAEHLAENLIQIRYKDGKVSFVNRNHFPEADWIPNNEAAGNIKDITLQVARQSGFVASFAHKDIYKQEWFKSQISEKLNREVASYSDIPETVTAKIAYLPLSEMTSAVSHIPDGAVLNVVRTNIEKAPVLISHQGFLVWKNGKAFFRHASKDQNIREIPLSQYLISLKKMPWRVLGLNVNLYQ